MQKIVYLWVCLVCLAWSAHAQNAGSACGNGRYANDVFTDVQTRPDVTFGSNTSINYNTGEESAADSLRFDFYEPVGDAAGQRPLVILAFGGSFVGGTRKDTSIVAICQAFARKGYVAAAIDYRLVQPGQFFVNYGLLLKRPDLLADELVRAANDMRAAVRYFKYAAAQFPNTYRVDPTHIFVGGYSAGAITALQVAYTDTDTENSDVNINAAYAKYGGLEGNTDLAKKPLLGTYDSKGIAGVFSLAGGVNDLGLLSAGNPPLYAAQGTADEVVPYDYGRVSFSNYMLYGSVRLQPMATTVGIANQLHPVAGGDHSSTVRRLNRSLITNEAAAFFQPLICAAPLPVTLTSFSGRVAPDDCTATLTWQTATEHNSYAYEVQGSADGQAYERLSTVPSRNRAAGATYSFRVGRRVDLGYFRLRMLDIDGTAAYSPVVALASCAAAPLLVAPTPTRDLATVSGLPAGRCVGVLYSATGQVVAQASGTATISLRLSSLAPGIYLLKVQSEGGATVGTAKVVKE